MLLIFLFFTASVALAQNSPFVGGWASRRADSCAAGESDCGVRSPPFRACCPQGQFCRIPVAIPGFQDNTGCCPTAADCSQDLAKFYVCANDEWSLYNNTGFPFCCPQGTRGGRNIAQSFDTCRPIAQPFPSGEVALPQDSPTSRNRATDPSASSILDTNSTETNAPQNAPKSWTLSTGGVVGIVVGGLLVVIIAGTTMWFVGRRMGQRRTREKEELLNQVGGIHSS